MSKVFEYIAGQTDGEVARLEAENEYALGCLGVELKENQKLRAALTRIAEQKTTAELNEEQSESADYEGAYDIIIGIARAAIDHPLSVETQK